MSDSLIDVADEINQLQYAIFITGTSRPTDREYALKEPVKPPIEPEFSACGNYKRVYEFGTWHLYKKEKKASTENFGFETRWVIVKEGSKKPDFPLP